MNLVTEVESETPTSITPSDAASISVNPIVLIPPTLRDATVNTTSLTSMDVATAATRKMVHSTSIRAVSLMMLKRVKYQLPTLNSIGCRLIRSYSAAAYGGSSEVANDEVYAELPRPPKSKSERKPYPTPMKLLIRRAKEEKEARKLQPCRFLETAPENGLLVPELVGVAHHVYHARGSLLKGLAELVRAIPVQRCRFCSEVHVGQTGHEIRTCTGPKSGFRSATHEWRKGGVQDVVSFPKCYHIYDRVGKPRVGHDDKHNIPRIPAVVELCIQAGVDLEKYPSKRRTKPVYSIEGRIVDFESVSLMEKVITEVLPLKNENEEVKKDQTETNTEKDLQQLSIETMDSWFAMVEGVKKLMESYVVWTCGYCPEVQVGPKGHKVRICKASKHQSRNGLHAWQEATVEDVIGYNYVWHSKSSGLYNDLKRFYGKAPAIVEVCVWGGAPIPNEFKSMMRLDVVSPDRDEVDLVA